jgi:hypothetical protein
MTGIASVSNYYQPLAENEPLPPLRDALNTVCRVPLRRVDRFVQLAVLGAARCAAGQTLRPDCALYLGSGLGPIANNVETQQQLIRDEATPKPINFINTLGTSAGFHVARNLELHGQTLFVSRRGASFEATLSVGLADLAIGAVHQALVGVVEEGVLPLAEHRRRQHLSANTPLAEGSHWLLLDAHGTADVASLEQERYPTLGRLQSTLAARRHAGDRLLCAATVASADAARFRELAGGKQTYSGNEWAFHDSISGARVTAFLAGRDSGSLFLVDGADETGWRLFHFRA